MQEVFFSVENCCAVVESVFLISAILESLSFPSSLITSSTFFVCGHQFFLPQSFSLPPFFRLRLCGARSGHHPLTVKLTEIFLPSGMHISPFLGRRKDEEKVLLSEYTDGLGFHLTARLKPKTFLGKIVLFLDEQRTLGSFTLTSVGANSLASHSVPGRSKKK